MIIIKSGVLFFDANSKFSGSNLILTAKESAFIQEFKLTGNATEAVRKAGYKVTHPKSAGAIGCRLLKKKHIANIVNKAQVNTEIALSQPIIREMPKEVSKLPDRLQFLTKGWDRTDTAKKEEVQARYYELVGKGLGFIGSSEDKKESAVFQVIANELKVFLGNSEGNHDRPISALERQGKEISVETSPTPPINNTSPINEALSHAKVLPENVSWSVDKFSSAGTGAGTPPSRGQDINIKPQENPPHILNSINNTKKVDSSSQESIN